MRRFYGHPSVLEPLAAEPEVVRSGVSAAASHGADIVTSDFLEAYVPEARIAVLVSRYGLDPDAERPNVVLRVVGEGVWPFAPEMDVAPRSVVAVDLLEADDERSRRAGAELARPLSWRVSRQPMIRSTVAGSNAFGEVWGRRDLVSNAVSPSKR
jgi:hypothetical protein